MSTQNQSQPKTPCCPWGMISRRDFMKHAAAASFVTAGVLTAKSLPAAEEKQSIPRKPVSVSLCKRYDYPLIRRTLANMFDEIGGVRSLVKRKHVTVKVNLVNTSEQSVGGVPLSYSVTTHPYVALALGSLFVDYGVKKVTFCDQLPFRTSHNEAFSGYGYDIHEFEREMEGRVQFENTRNLGRYKQYSMAKTPGGGYLANAWEVNKAYTDTDVFVSLGKLKSHVSGGVTMGMKNLIGVPPSSLYGDDIFKDDLTGEPDENAIGYRGHTMHTLRRRTVDIRSNLHGEIQTR